MVAMRMGGGRRWVFARLAITVRLRHGPVRSIIEHRDQSVTPPSGTVKSRSTPTRLKPAWTARACASAALAVTDGILTRPAHPLEHRLCLREQRKA